MRACHRRCVIARVPAAPYWHINFVKTTRKVASKARRSAPSAQLVDSMDKSLTPQAFASNNLNRSLADRRDAEFIRIAFPHAHYVIVSGSKVMVSRNPAVRLRWVEASELQKLSYSPAADGTIQHSQRGMLAIVMSCMAGGGQSIAVSHECWAALSIYLPLIQCSCCAAEPITPFLLGKEESTWRMVIEAPEDLLHDIESSSHEFADLRSLMPELPTEELAVAGHAVALSQWHKVTASFVYMHPARWHPVCLGRCREDSLHCLAFHMHPTGNAAVSRQSWHSFGAIAWLSDA